MSDSGASHVALGVEPGRVPLAAAGSRELGTEAGVLPEIAEAPARQRRWWLHPAFVLSLVMTVLALAGAAAWWIVSAANDDAVRVSGLTIAVEQGNVALHWEGPDAPYALYEVGADGDAVDLTALVRGTSAWVFSAAGLFDRGSCFVVRPASRTEEVTLDAAALQAQNSAAACVADAR